MKIISKSWLLLLVGISLLGLGACAPAASKSASRAQINAGAIVPESQIRVAEYLRYYDQHFPEPTEGVLGLDLRLGNEEIPLEGGMAWLQIGFQGKSAEVDIVAPLNLALVIDRSGSMDTPDKMPYVKESLRIFLESLNPDDIVSIVTYSSGAEVLVPAQNVDDGAWVRAVIDRIEPGGGTNLHAGLMLGLQEVDKNFDVRRNNRVILLTDGIANEGVTDPQVIAAEAKAYNDRGIYLSTIGLGLDFNDGLLTDLAYQGQGDSAFVDSADEMDRVFREQAAGLKQRVASELSVTILPAEGVRLIGITGAENVPQEGANVPLPAMNTGESSVILAKFEVESAARTGLHPIVTVQLSYFDEFAQRPVTIEQEVSATLVSNMQEYDPTWDLEVLRNVTIQQTAEGMIEIDRLFQAGRYEDAWRVAVELEQQLAEVARLTKDEQMEEDVILMQRYQQTLADIIRQTESREPSMENSSPVGTPERPYRGRATGEPTATPAVPTVEIR